MQIIDTSCSITYLQHILNLQRKEGRDRKCEHWRRAAVSPSNRTAEEQTLFQSALVKKEIKEQNSRKHGLHTPGNTHTWQHTVHSSIFN